MQIVYFAGMTSLFLFASKEKMVAKSAEKSVSDNVFERIAGWVLDGELAVGDSLPGERVLCEQLGVNRGAIREAIKRLQQASLVEVRHGGATKVLDYLDQGGLELLPSLLVTSDGRLRLDVAKSIIAMRQTMAPDIARACALNRSEVSLQQLQSVVAQMQTTDPQDLDTLQVLAFAYWRELVMGSGNIAYRLALNSMNKAYLKVWPLLASVLATELQDIETLEKLTSAIAEQDADQAGTMAGQYLRNGSEAMQAMLASLGAAEGENEITF